MIGRGRLGVDGDGALDALMQNVEQATAGLLPAKSWDELRQQVPGVIHACVDVILLLDGKGSQIASSETWDRAWPITPWPLMLGIQRLR